MTRRAAVMVAGLVAATTSVIGTSPAAAAPVSVTGGSIEWGIRASFRTYVVGPIAHGSVVADGGATQADGNGVFTFPVASGSRDTSAGTTEAAADGSVHFLGHDGILDVLVSDLRIEIDGSTGFVVADVVSKEFIDTTTAGEPVTYDDVPLVELDLTGITPTVAGDTVTYTGVPTELTAEGVPAFGGFYEPPNTVFDLITFTLELSDEEPEPEPEPEATAEVEVSTTVAPTGLTISIANGTVVLPTPTLNAGGTALETSGALGAVTVTDARATDPGWNVTAQVSDFTGTAGTFDDEALGWTPSVTSSSTGQTVTAGSVLVPGTGLDGAELAEAAPGAGQGTAVLGATLNLRVPTTTPPGSYAATLTLTAI